MTPLYLYNTLTRRKELFVPLALAGTAFNNLTTAAFT